MIKYLNDKRKKKKGQTTLEYAILVIIIIAALISIQTYIKRGIQGRLRSAADDIGDQYSPGNTNVVVRTVSKSTTLDRNFQGDSKSTLVSDEVSNTTTNITIVNGVWSFWGGK